MLSFRTKSWSFGRFTVRSDDQRFQLQVPTFRSSPPSVSDIPPLVGPGCCALPPEILDHTVDQMRDDRTTLKTCCLASKSWIHRTRKLLFAHIGFGLSTWVESWKNAFPDPMNSTAHHARSLSISNHHFVTAADVDTITTFFGVESLRVKAVVRRDERTPLSPLHGLFPVLRSLHLSFVTLPDSFGLICSFPLLEDFALLSVDRGSRSVGWNPLSTSPRFTGSLRLNVMFEGSQPIAHQLLDLPNGLHFTKIAVESLREQEVKPTMDLVSRCADTLQSLDITYNRSGVFPSLSA